MLGHRKLEIADYAAIARRRLWLIVLCSAVCAGIGYGITKFITPRFMSQTLIIIEEQKVPDEYVKPVIASNLDSRLASMKEQIQSRSRIQPIVERDHLYENNHMSMDERIDMTRKGIDIKPIHSTISATAGLPGFFITFTANDAHTAQLVCHEITTLFLNENMKSREEVSEGTTEFLKGQLADAKRNLDEQDAKLAAFQRQYFGKLPSEQGSNVNMLTSLNTQLEAITQQLARMEQDKTYMESILAQQTQMYTTAPLPGSKEPAVSVPLTAELQQKQTQLTALQNQEAQLLTHYTADYPDVIAVRRQIADLNKQIEKASTPAVSANGTPLPTRGPVESLGVQQLRAQIRAIDVGITAKHKEQDQLNAAVRTYQSRIESSPAVEEQYKELTRDYDTAKTFYDDLLTKMNHSKMATDLEIRQQGEQFRMMDAPNLPDSPSYPRVPVFVMGGLLVGLVLSCGISALLEYRDTALRSERDVWAFTHLPTLAIISVAHGDENHAGRWTRMKRFLPRRSGKADAIKTDKEALAGANG